MKGKLGLWIAAGCAALILISVGYGMGKKAAASSAQGLGSLAPAGAPLNAVQIEPIQPQEELAAISATPKVAPKIGAVASAAPVLSENPAVSSTGATSSTSTDAASASSSSEDSGRIREIQQALKNAGFDPGAADGKMGQKTKTAIRDFQVAKGLEADGKVGPRTWSKLEPYLKSTATASSKSTSND